MSSRASAIAPPGIVLSQPTRATMRVERAAGDQLDRVGDDLAADQRGLHPCGAHRDAVGDRDRVELHRRAAGRPDPLLDVLGEPQVLKLQGIVSIQVLATPTIGLARSSAV